MELNRNFGRGTMNKDVDERLLPDGQYRDALNITVGSSSDSNIGAIQNIPGNEQVSDLSDVTGLNVVNARTIGSVSVESLGLIYWLVASDEFDGVFEYNKNTGTTSYIAVATKSGGNDSILGFNQSYIVTGINHLEGMLIWTDNLNEIFKINISRARTYAIDDPRLEQDITLIKGAPINAPYIVMSDDGTQSNNMSEKFLYFATRWKYLDNEYSALSPFTSAAFVPGPYTFDPQKGYNGAMVNEFNKVNITFETGTEFVKEIQLVMLDSTSKNVFIIQSFNKDKLNIPNDFSYQYTGFSNNKTYTALPSEQITRLFDNVPLKAKSLDIVGIRAILGNYVQFYDIVNSNLEDISIDFTVSYRNDLGTPTEANPLQTFRSDRDFEIALQYLDDLGRMTPALVSPTNTIYIRPEDSWKANSLLVEINNVAPYWATSWRLSIKQSKTGYYNLFPILFYKDGNYRYFLLNESDRDKIAVGEYVIFKAGPEGITGNNKQYKILEIAQKEAGFISGGVSEIAGLYFKIKVEDATVFSPSSLYTYNNTGEGCNSTNPGNVNLGEITYPPITNSFKVAENPIFYGDGNGSVLTVSGGNAYNGQNDLRYTIEIESSTTFRYTTAVSGSAPYIQSAQTIVANTDIPILLPNGVTTAFTIRFSTTTGYVTGDKWKVSCRGTVFPFSTNVNYFGGIGISMMGGGTPASLVGGYAIVPGVSWSPTPSPEVDRSISIGAVITLNILEDKHNPNQQAGVQQFPPSDRNYANIEEWFVESGAWQLFQQIDLNGTNVGASRVSFRRGNGYQFLSGFTPGGDLSNTVDQGGAPDATTLSYPVRMFIAGCGIDDGPDNQNHIRVEFTIQQQNNSNIVETVPKPNDADIYHELTRTYPVVNGNHIVNWAYEDFIFYTSSGPYNGYTALTQLTPTRPHYFEVGETITVTTSNGLINGTWIVLEVPDLYTVVINLSFPGAGPVTPGIIAHNTIDTDQGSFPGTAKVIINNPSNQNSTYNAWSFGNGLESNRIKDDFNQTTLEYSPRATSTIEDYRQMRKAESLTYSGEYNKSSGINRLNEFNLSIANFKDLDKSFGSVQKLYTRDTDLVVFQESKVSTVLFGKNLLSNSTGGGDVVSIPEVLGTQIALPYEYGIGKNPESFAAWGPDLFFVDAYHGTPIQMTGNELRNLDQFGMKNYFRDMFLSGPNTQKLGIFDPYRKVYVLASNNISSVPCQLDVSRTLIVFSNAAQPDVFLFTITSDSTWTITLTSLGDGTSWFTGFPTTGTGGMDVYGSVANNGTSANRQLQINVTYCGGLTKTIILRQSRGPKGNIISIIFNTPRENASKSKL
jgi:hypothetical protein